MLSTWPESGGGFFPPAFDPQALQHINNHRPIDSFQKQNLALWPPTPTSEQDNHVPTPSCIPPGWRPRSHAPQSAGSSSGREKMLEAKDALDGRCLWSFGLPAPNCRPQSPWAPWLPEMDHSAPLLLAGNQMQTNPRTGDKHSHQWQRTYQLLQIYTLSLSFQFVIHKCKNIPLKWISSLIKHYHV